MNYNVLFIINLSLFIFGFLEFVAINEEILLALCFLVFISSFYIFLGNDFFNSNNEKSLEVQKNFVVNLTKNSFSLSQIIKNYSRIWSGKSFYLDKTNQELNRLKILLNSDRKSLSKNLKKLNFLHDIWNDSQNNKNLKFFGKIFSLNFIW